MSGRELAKLLIPDQPGMKVLYLSGYTGHAVSTHGILPDGSAFLEKPFRLLDFAGKVRAVLDAAGDRKPRPF